MIIIGVLIAPHKYYLLKPFLRNLSELEIPVDTELYFVADEEDYRTRKVLYLWKEGKIKSRVGFPNETLKGIAVFTVGEPGEYYMFRIAKGRQLIVERARANPNCSHILFLDADMLVPSNTLTKLLQVDGELVAALVKIRSLTRPSRFNNYIDRRSEGKGFPSISEFKEGEILNVDATGHDCILISRKAFSRINYEYKPELPEAEDMGFCLKARRLGFRVRIHTGIKTRHIDIDDVELI